MTRQRPPTGGRSVQQVPAGIAPEPVFQLLRATGRGDRGTVARSALRGPRCCPAGLLEELAGGLLAGGLAAGGLLAGGLVGGQRPGPQPGGAGDGLGGELAGVHEVGDVLGGGAEVACCAVDEDPVPRRAALACLAARANRRGPVRNGLSGKRRRFATRSSSPARRFSHATPRPPP